MADSGQEIIDNIRDELTDIEFTSRELIFLKMIGFVIDSKCNECTKMNKKNES